MVRRSKDDSTGEAGGCREEPHPRAEKQHEELIFPPDVERWQPGHKLSPQWGTGVGKTTPEKPGKCQKSRERHVRNPSGSSTDGPVLTAAVAPYIFICCCDLLTNQDGSLLVTWKPLSRSHRYHCSLWYWGSFSPRPSLACSPLR